MTNVLPLLVTTLLWTAAQAEETKSPSVPSPERGYHWLLTKPYFEADFTADDFAKLWTIWPDALKAEAEQASESKRRQLTLSRYGFIEAPERKDGPPLGFVDDGHQGWSMNCLFCHGGKVAGKAVPGVGNSHVAFQTFVADLVKYRVSQKESVSQAMVSRLMTPMGRSNGTTNAQIFSVALTAMRDNELNFVPPRSLPVLVHHDLDAPPLWNVKHKKNLYIDGYVQKSHRVIMQFVFVPSNNAATIKSWESDFADILAWIESLEAPKYPWGFDETLAEQGRTVFNANCAECHGTYGETVSYPEKAVAIDEIGTDPVRWRGMSAKHRSFFHKGWIGEYGKVAVEESPIGYVAPPLSGIWASAPYFHNGAIPTLWHVLHPNERPAVWKRTEDGYDTTKVGLEVEALPEVPPGITDTAEQRTYFNTKQSGKSAAGHDYPNALSKEEKRAVLEYLKTL